MYAVKIFGQTYETDVKWTGSVFQRDDCGAQYAELRTALRRWLEDLVQAGGDDPDEFRAEIEAAIETARETSDVDESR